jgi:hypothetical protein
MDVRRWTALILWVNLVIGLGSDVALYSAVSSSAPVLSGQALPAIVLLDPQRNADRRTAVAQELRNASAAVASLPTTPNWVAEGNQVDAFYGRSVGTAGDVNGDGYADLIVGAPGYDGGAEDEGRAYVYYGGPTGLTAMPVWTADGDQAWARLGQSVGTAGDVNGDGYADVVISADRFDAGQVNEGRVYVYHGSSSGLGTIPAWTAEGDQEGAQFGHVVGTAGDVNGDGYADLLVGANKYDSGQVDEGRVYVYHGGPAGLASTPAWAAESDQAGAYLGCRIGTVGDANGDGYADAVVGADGYDADYIDEGRAYVFLGGSTGLAEIPAWIAEGNQAGASLGLSVGTAGDVNGDGYADAVVGARNYDAGEVDEGRAFVYYGGISGLAQTAAWTAESDQAGAWFGWSVGTAGDINGDGYADLVVGANRYSGGETREGRAYIYLGAPAGLAGTPAWTGEGDQAYAHFGQSVGTAGDVNGDGYADVVIGAYLYDARFSNEGRAYVYYGEGEIPLVGFASETYYVDESAGSATVDVILDRPVNRTVRVDCRTRNGTAQARRDYDKVNTTLVFPPGVTVQTFSVSIVDDARDEGSETVHMFLSKPDGAILDQARKEATLVILDNTAVSRLRVSSMRP